MLRHALPRGLAWHTPNGVVIGGTQSERAAAWARVEALGALPGFPDLAVAQDGRLYTLEVKSATGTASPEQRDVHAALLRAGIPNAIVRDAEEAYRTLDGWGVALRRMQWRLQPPPPVHSLVRPLTAEWHTAMSDAVEAWRVLLDAMPPRGFVYQELGAAESRLRQIALTVVP